MTEVTTGVKKISEKINFPTINGPLAGIQQSGAFTNNGNSKVYTAPLSCIIDPHLFEPHKIVVQGQTQFEGYSANFLFPKAYAAAIDVLLKGRAEVIKGFFSGNEATPTKENSWPLKDGDEVALKKFKEIEEKVSMNMATDDELQAAKDKIPAFMQGNFLMRSQTKLTLPSGAKTYPPSIEEAVVENGKVSFRPIRDPKQLYSGCFGFPVFTVKPYKARIGDDGKPIPAKVSFYLAKFIKVCEGEKLTTYIGTGAVDSFTALGIAPEAAGSILPAGEEASHQDLDALLNGLA